MSAEFPRLASFPSSDSSSSWDLFSSAWISDARCPIRAISAASPASFDACRARTDLLSKRFEKVESQRSTKEG